MAGAFTTFEGGAQSLDSQLATEITEIQARRDVNKTWKMKQIKAGQKWIRTKQDKIRGPLVAVAARVEETQWASTKCVHKSSLSVEKRNI